VVVVAAYPALRAGLQSLLSSDPSLEPVAAERVWLGSDAGRAPAVIVVDFSAGEPEELLTLSEAFPAAPLVLVGADPAGDGPGLSGVPVAYLPSDVDAEALAAAVHAAAAGLIAIDPVLAGAAGIHAHARNPVADDALTPREREVLLLVAEGLPNKAIARELGISEHTAKFHVGSLLGKLGAASRTEAVTIATRRGLLPV
jgi:DNA-binding NarL/FixJ family response regulator